MKTEQRTVYIAEDGVEFDDEDGCKSYERAKNLSKFICGILDEQTYLPSSDREEVAEVVANNIVTILAAYNKL